MGRQTGCAGVTSAIGAGPVRDEMLRLSRWIYFLAVSLAVCVLEIIAFLKYGPFSLDGGKRWLAMFWFLPFVSLFVSIDIGMLGSARRARSGLGRVFKQLIFGVCTIAIFLWSAAVVWFVFVAK